MKFDVVIGNPTITKQGEDRYQVIYADPSLAEIQNFQNLTYDKALNLSFVDKAKLDLLK